MSSVAAQNATLADSCRSSPVFVSDEFLAPYNASYTFCQEAANKCVDGSLGTANVSMVTVQNTRSSVDEPPTRTLYYFYSQSFFGNSNRNLLSCLKDNGLENVTMFWAPGQQVRDNARVVSDVQSLSSAASSSFRRPKRSSSSLTQLLTFAVAFTFVFQHLFALASASSLPPVSSLQRRAFGCLKFEPQGEPFKTTINSARMSPGNDCLNQPRCIIQAFGNRLAYSGDLMYEISGRNDQPIKLDAQGLIESSFNSTLIERYSQANRQRASTAFFTISSDSKASQFLQASKTADLYNGTFTQCEDGNPYPARLWVPTAEWLYNFVTTS